MDEPLGQNFKSQNGIFASRSLSASTAETWKHTNDIKSYE